MVGRSGDVLVRGFGKGRGSQGVSWGRRRSDKFKGRFVCGWQERNWGCKDDDSDVVNESFASGMEMAGAGMLARARAFHVRSALPSRCLGTHVSKCKYLRTWESCSRADSQSDLIAINYIIHFPMMLLMPALPVSNALPFASPSLIVRVVKHDLRKIERIPLAMCSELIRNHHLELSSCLCVKQRSNIEMSLPHAEVELIAFGSREVIWWRCAGYLQSTDVPKSKVGKA